MDLGILKLLADTGTLGILLTIAIMAIAYLYRALMAEKNKELQDKDQMIIVLRSEDDAMKQILIQQSWKKDDIQNVEQQEKKA